mmetsp:Transcript_111017/g.314190  ORF Transcript_111017/g.314190 Transcript_111017/m.314190 type:complete len:228 (+) Transcript_111017:277-960(+)
MMVTCISETDWTIIAGAGSGRTTFSFMNVASITRRAFTSPCAEVSAGRGSSTSTRQRPSCVWLWIGFWYTQAFGTNTWQPSGSRTSVNDMEVLRTVPVMSPPARWTTSPMWKGVRQSITTPVTKFSTGIFTEMPMEKVIAVRTEMNESMGMPIWLMTMGISCIQRKNFRLSTQMFTTSFLMFQTGLRSMARTMRSTAHTTMKNTMKRIKATITFTAVSVAADMYFSQ